MVELHTIKSISKLINELDNKAFRAMLEGRVFDEESLDNLRFNLMLERAAMIDNEPKKADYKKLFASMI